jgi:hypothetical protein
VRHLKKFIILCYLVPVFHLPIWRRGYRNYKYQYLGDMSRWMQWTIGLRNDFEAEFDLHDTWVWVKVGRLYIRSNCAVPGDLKFKYSYSHLFVWRVGP